MHRGDAKKLGIEHGETVRIASRRGAVEAEAWISPRVRRGCIWMPMHFAESRANLLTNDAGDCVTGTGEYKVCAVRVEKVRTGAASATVAQVPHAPTILNDKER